MTATNTRAAAKTTEDRQRTKLRGTRQTSKQARPGWRQRECRAERTRNARQRDNYTGAESHIEGRLRGDENLTKLRDSRKGKTCERKTTSVRAGGQHTQERSETHAGTRTPPEPEREPPHTATKSSSPTDAGCDVGLNATANKRRITMEVTECRAKATVREEPKHVKPERCRQATERHEQSPGNVDREQTNNPAKKNKDGRANSRTEGKNEKTAYESVEKAIPPWEDAARAKIKSLLRASNRPSPGENQEGEVDARRHPTWEKRERS